MFIQNRHTGWTQSNDPPLISEMSFGVGAFKIEQSTNMNILIHLSTPKRDSVSLIQETRNPLF